MRLLFSWRKFSKNEESIAINQFKYRTLYVCRVKLSFLRRGFLKQSAGGIRTIEHVLRHQNKFCTKFRQILILMCNHEVLKFQKIHEILIVFSVSRHVVQNKFTDSENSELKGRI